MHRLPIKCSLFFVFLLLPLCIFSKSPAFLEKYKDHYCFFTPPKSWDCIDPKQLSSPVKVGFVGPQQGAFSPTINLAVEKLSSPLSLKQYVQAVKKIHKANKHTKWRDLGSFHSRAGLGQITELTRRDKGGSLRMLQFLFVQGEYAYIITAAASKEHFQKHSPTFLSAIRSFTLAPDLLNAIASPENRELLKKALNNLAICSKTDKEVQKKSWQDVQHLITDNCQPMGLYWQILMTEYAHATYLSSP